MIVVLTRPENAKSAIKLGYPLYNSAGSVPSGSKVIRWGNGMEPDARGWNMVLNKATAMEVSTDKLAALESMARVVKTPKIYREGESVPSGTVLVVRPASHAEGSDFELVTAPRNYRVPSGLHGTTYVPDTREYRVWFVREKYLVAKRVPRSSEGQTASDPCRSKWGYSFYDECFPKLAEQMALARSAVPLDFGAADVLWTDNFEGSGTGQWVFLEFNSAPSLDHDKVLSHFQRHLVAIVGRQDVAMTPEPSRPAPVAPATIRRAIPSDGISEAGSWESRYEAKLRAERAAKEKAIRDRVYGDL